MSNRKRTYTDTEAISHILEWIENDKEEEGEDDLVELYRDEAEGRDGHENSNNNGMETTNLSNLSLPGCSNISSPLPVEENDVDFVYATNLLTKTVEENDIEVVIPVVTHVPRKLLTPNRIINSLDAALEPGN